MNIPTTILGSATIGLIAFIANTGQSQPMPSGIGGDSFKMPQPLITNEGITPGKAIVPTNRIDLFNGKDFSGWTFFMRTNADPMLTWAVTNGVMRCQGQPFGYARTESTYRDYKLTVEWRFVKVAPQADNSGVFVHVQLPDRIWPKCIECQGQYQKQGDMILMGGATAPEHETTATRMLHTKETQNEKPAGEWNTYEIVCSGDGVKVFVNGKSMNEQNRFSISSGAIALQSEGGEFEVRKVFLEPIPQAL